MVYAARALDHQLWQSGQGHMGSNRLQNYA